MIEFRDCRSKNKMDLVGYDEYCFQKIFIDIKNFVKELENIKIILMSVIQGIM